ncbi:MAG TPA: TIGR02678 family protein [Ktedonobacteraceae bacterium]|jgi:uncharacterized protein (TIGR02678 family)
MQNRSEGYNIQNLAPDEGWEDEEEGIALDALPAPSLVSHTARDLLLAHAALLDHVVVSLPADAEAYRLVRTHLKALEQWHEKHTGWRVQRGATFFRLEHHLHMVAPVFFDEKLKKARDFAYLTWILWFAEKRYLAGGGRNQQFLLSQLTEELQEQMQHVDSTGLDIRNVQDRYSMSRALSYLIDLGCLHELEGDLRKWAEDADQAEHEVLYEFTPIAHSLIEALNAGHVGALQASLAVYGWAAPSGSLPTSTNAIPPLVRAWRVLLLGPALLRYDDPEAFTALSTQAEKVNDELGETFGWSLELNADYACIVRGGGISIGAGPAITLNGAHDQMLLLLCSSFREQVEQGVWIPDAYGCIHVTHWDISPLFHALRQRYGSYWGNAVRDAKASSLLETVYRRMHQCGLLRGPDAEDKILILPTAARYSVRYKQLREEEAPGRARAQAREKNARPDVSQSMLDWSELAPVHEDAE